MRQMMMLLNGYWRLSWPRETGYTHQQIAISKANEDYGMFVLNFFLDDRYFPFEGSGAVSTWRLEMPHETNPDIDFTQIEDAIIVPQEAIVRQGTKHIVYKLDRDDAAQQVTVALGRFFANGVHVRTGIEPSARVVAAGQQKLRPGAPTVPTPFDRTENPNLELGRLEAENCREPR